VHGTILFGEGSITNVNSGTNDWDKNVDLETKKSFMQRRREELGEMK
jgi:hypothetical protein